MTDWSLRAGSSWWTTTGMRWRLAMGEQAASYRPDMILLDIGLPKVNGYDVCRRIRAEPWGKAMGVIALTGWGREDDRRQTAQAGFTGHLVKPVDYALLTELLARVGEPAQPCVPC